MHTHRHILRAALAALVVLLPIRSEAQTSAERPHRRTAQRPVSELLSHRRQLSLTGGQVDSLTALANRIRVDRGRLQVVGFDGVPGKSVPRFVRVYPVRQRAGERALRLLSPEQRQGANRLLREGRRVNTAHR